MSSINRFDRRRFTLLDHNGPWCAWCLGSIPSNEPTEIHHVLPTEAVNKLLPWPIRLPWTVPAHHDCHRKQLQLMSGGLSSFLQRALTLSPTQLRELNERLHNASFYWFPVLTYSRELIESKGENEETMAYLFSSASGIRKGRRFLARLMGAFPVPPSARELVNLSNLEFSSGSYRRAENYLKIAQSRLNSSAGAARDATRAAFLRRKAQLQLDVAAASEAQALSESNPYTVRTSVLHKGWIHFTKDQVAEALNHFQFLEETTNPTWLYRAEVLFAHALCSIALRKTDEETYACLVTAQYLYAMLGLVGPSSRFLWYNRHRSSFTNTPTDVLLNEDSFHRFKREQCFEIRQAALFGLSRPNVLKTVLGDQNLRDTLFDGLHHAFPK